MVLSYRCILDTKVVLTLKFQGAVEPFSRVCSLSSSLEMLWQGLIPTNLRRDTATGEPYYSMGAAADSYYEYLIKVWLASNKKVRCFAPLHAPMSFMVAACHPACSLHIRDHRICGERRLQCMTDICLFLPDGEVPCAMGDGHG